MMTIVRRSARALLVDDRARLLLIKRVRPGRAPYWTTPGGGVESQDASVEAALHRELAEELGASVGRAVQVFFASSGGESGLSVQYYFVCRLVSLDEGALWSGPEFADPARGRYELDRIDLCGGDLAGIDLMPQELKVFVLSNREALLAEVELACDLTGRSGVVRPGGVLG